MTEKYGQSFTGEANEGSVIISGELFLRGNNFSNSSPGFAYLQPRFPLLGALYRGDSPLVRGLILLQFSHRGNHRGRMYQGT